MTFVRPVQRWELDRIADEEDRKVISNKVPVALLSLELEGKTANVTSSIRGSLFSGNRRDAG
jgi:hypothetical protein